MIKNKQILKKKNYIKKVFLSEKIIQLKRVTKIVKGGKKIKTQAIVIVGDKKYSVGIGIGVAEDAGIAIQKAILNGKKNLLTIPRTVQFSIPHIIKASYGASDIILRPAIEGTGLIASGVIRTILEFGGIKNILGKQLGSHNILNTAKATILGLTQLKQTINLSKLQLVRKTNFYKKLMKNF